MSAEVLKFPHTKKHVIYTLLKSSKVLEKESPIQCIQLQRKIISMLMVECNRSTRALVATRTALDALLSKPDQC